MTRIDTVLTTGKTHTTVNHDAHSRGREERLDIKLSAPRNRALPEYAFPAIQAHPTAEQMFAGAWSACLISAIGLAAKEQKVELPHDLALDIAVDLGKSGDAYLLAARIEVSMPGIARDVAQAIVHAADQICPYSKATRGNIDVAINVI
ncbi:Ohr family peroxiredoxin [Paraburkholderia rhizosphaerae]|uniref:Ohr subfamily peroxiredoxin n=1 Tax=Paraburkholderia rhizosphaerae TaxID=480658 RepID=A0A4R8LLE5_9BURK|nr:Ohr family peroxiredoxin [Paraburkholderia rhizosphaerae]TDY43827.1 Ohr subfamily peroxiredoxin [Paraburkholderia rhizosphaerae]